jgi:hypothetical protein
VPPELVLRSATPRSITPRLCACLFRLRQRCVSPNGVGRYDRVIRGGKASRLSRRTVNPATRPNKRSTDQTSPFQLPSHRVHKHQLSTHSHAPVSAEQRAEQEQRLRHHGTQRHEAGLAFSQGMSRMEAVPWLMKRHASRARVTLRYVRCWLDPTSFYA